MTSKQPYWIKENIQATTRKLLVSPEHPSCARMAPAIGGEPSLRMCKGMRQSLRVGSHLPGQPLRRAGCDQGSGGAEQGSCSMP